MPVVWGMKCRRIGKPVVSLVLVQSRRETPNLLAGNRVLLGALVANQTKYDLGIGFWRN